MKYLVILSFSFMFSSSGECQVKNSYLFIETNVSVDYDSNVFKKGNRYSNSVYETEAYDFYVKESGKKSRLHIKATQGSGKDFPQAKMDKFMNDRLPMLPKMMGDSLTVVSVDTAVRHIGAFTCSGGSFRGKYEAKSKASVIIANHITADDGTEVDFLLYDVDDLDKAYSMLGEFLSGFKFYSKEKIEKEDSIVKSMYTIEVIPAFDSTASFWEPAFSGIVKTKEPLHHQLKEVWIKMDIGDEIFTPSPNDNKVLIRTREKKKGIIECKGQFVVLNSFGKKVKIPFTFTYENK